MKKITRNVIWMLILVLAACSSPNTEKAGQGSRNKEPVTLSIVIFDEASDNNFRFIQSLIQSRYPHITLERIKPGNGNVVNHLNNSIAAGLIPDLFTIGVGGIPYLLESNIMQPLDAYAKESKFDEGKYQSGVIETVRKYSPDGKLFGIPYNIVKAALYYNKDLFDRFGVSYPKDGITWDEAKALAARLSRVDNGIQYTGLDIRKDVLTSFNQLSIPFIEASTGIPTFDSNEDWKRHFSLFKEIMKIPNNGITEKNSWNQETNMFIKDRNLAMVVMVTPNLLKASEVNWDVVTMPVFPDKPKSGIQYNGDIIGVTTASKYKQDAYLVAELLAAAEYQRFIAKEEGMIPALKDAAILKVFSDGFPDKNMDALFKTEIAPSPGVHPNDLEARQTFNRTVRSFLVDEMDINTYLRFLQGEAIKAIEQKKS